MMPDLGKYAVEVASAYAVSILLIIALVAFSLVRAQSVRARLREVEKRRAENG